MNIQDQILAKVKSFIDAQTVDITQGVLSSMVGDSYSTQITKLFAPAIQRGAANLIMPKIKPFIGMIVDENGQLDNELIDMLSNPFKMNVDQTLGDNFAIKNGGLRVGIAGKQFEISKEELEELFDSIKKIK